MFTPILMTFAGSDDDDDAMRGVAISIATMLREEGLETDVRDLRIMTSLAPYRAVILGAPFSDGAWHGAARQFLGHFRDALIALPVAVFALGPEMPDPMDRGGRRELLEELATYRWLHPIAAEMFREVTPALPVPLTAPLPVVTGAVNGATAMERQAANARPIDHDEVRAWARLVARLLIPAPAR
jgi:menaquinone-dependent protoporphyrinogen IX oxidase